jgi:hypothetical protein
LWYNIGMKPSLPCAFITIICCLKIGASNLYCTSSLQPNGVVHIDSDIWISHFHNTEYSCSQHGPATPWLMLIWQGICQKHLLWTEYIVYCHVMLGSIIKWLGQSIKQGRLHIILHFASLFKCSWSVLQIILKWTENGWSCMRCAFSFYQLVSLPSMLTGIKLTAEQNMWSKNMHTTGWLWFLYLWMVRK